MLKQSDYYPDKLRSLLGLDGLRESASKDSTGLR